MTAATTPAFSPRNESPPKKTLSFSAITGGTNLPRDGVLLVRAVSGTRARWAEAFCTMTAARDDRLVDAPPASSSQWDGDEWVW